MIISNLNVLRETYLALHATHLVQSKADFSVRYLDKGPSYLSSMQARARQVPNPVIAMLQWSLQREIASMRDILHLGSPHAVGLNAAYACLNQLHQMVRRHRAAMERLERVEPSNDTGPNRWPPFGPAAIALEPESPLADCIAQGRIANGL